jgi:hypothetical protein
VDVSGENPCYSWLQNDSPLFEKIGHDFFVYTVTHINKDFGSRNPTEIRVAR